ncbi:MAG: ABC transporter ATP-binding protein [Anaerolineales bacterium]|nr:ABC transporter ATP-binding protein [Anaerolineales bacterium]MCB8962287.1 ABC transporter ATP-binding protein [Ardenticatenales bacterium]
MVIDHEYRQPQAIKVNGLRKSYGANLAVAGLDLEVTAGEIFALLGPNGAGKTTALNMIYGLLAPDAGTVQLLGRPMTPGAQALKAQIGVQLQATSLLPELTALEQLLLFARLYGQRLSRAEALELLASVDLSAMAAALPDKMSGGQQQRLALALALVNDPALIFLDEPTAGLDPAARRDLWELIRSLRRRGKTVLFTTHYLEEAEALADRVGIMDRGRLVALDRPAALTASLGQLSTIQLTVALTAAQINALPAVQLARREGERWLLQSVDAPATLSALFAQAAAVGQPVADLVVSQPKLEDLFLELTGRSAQLEVNHE